MMPSNKAQAILQLLVDNIRSGYFIPDEPRSFLGYKQIHGKLGLNKLGPHWGGSLNNQGLSELAIWLRKEGLPAITGLIVNQATNKPGDGYFEVNGHTPNDLNWWADEIRAAIAFDWSEFVADDAVPNRTDLAAFEQAVSEGRLHTIEVTVRSRCEALRKRARQFYLDADHKLSCELCGWNKPHNLIAGDIVELHHMRHLGDLPCEGDTLTMKQAIASLVPLCPTCHRIAHSRIGNNRDFPFAELKAIIPRYARVETLNRC